jgi:hypothetical protein
MDEKDENHMCPRWPVSAIELTFRSAHGSFHHSNRLQAIRGGLLFKQALSLANEALFTVSEPQSI